MTSARTASSLKVALVSIGLGRVQRGYERYFSDLFGVLRNDLDITLYRGRGPCGAGEKVPFMLGPTTALARLLPFGQLATGGEYRKYKHDCVAFGLSLLPALIRRRFDVIHIIDYPLAKVLDHLRRATRFSGRLLLTNGGCIPPEYYPRVDHIHHVAEPLYTEALAAGIPSSHLTMVPCGIHTQRFESPLSRRELRRKHGIADTTFVILAVTAVKRLYKRVDHIIEEVSRLDGDLLLWIDGNPEDPSIPELARRKLGSRCRISHVPSETVGELYRAADVLVHACLAEAFGLAVVEALSTGLPVLVHDSPHYAWLVGNRDSLIDMTEPGALAARLRSMMARREDLSDGAEARAASVRNRLDWKALAPAYMTMYQTVAGSTRQEQGCHDGAH